MKIKRFIALALTLVFCLCFTACGDVPLDKNGCITLDSAKALAQPEVDKYCRDNSLQSYKFYSHTYGKHFPEHSTNEKDIFLFYNEAGERKFKNEQIDLSTDIVVCVSYDGKDVRILGTPNDNPFDSSDKKDSNASSDLDLYDFSGEWMQENGESYYSFDAEGVWSEIALDGYEIFSGDLEIENDILQLVLPDGQVYLEITFENNNCLEEVGGAKLYPYAPKE